MEAMSYASSRLYVPKLGFRKKKNPAMQKKKLNLKLEKMNFL